MINLLSRADRLGIYIVWLRKKHKLKHLPMEGGFVISFLMTPARRFNSCSWINNPCRPRFVNKIMINSYHNYHLLHLLFVNMIVMIKGCVKIILLWQHS